MAFTHVAPDELLTDQAIAFLMAQAEVEVAFEILGLRQRDAELFHQQAREIVAAEGVGLDMHQFVLTSHQHGGAARAAIDDDGGAFACQRAGNAELHGRTTTSPSLRPDSTSMPPVTGCPGWTTTSVPSFSFIRGKRRLSALNQSGV